MDDKSDIELDQPQKLRDVQCQTTLEGLYCAGGHTMQQSSEPRSVAAQDARKRSRVARNHGLSKYQIRIIYHAISNDYLRVSNGRNAFLSF